MSHCTQTCSDRQQDSLDVLLIGVVLTFAFLSASFVETSTDFWYHLAAGRRLAGAEFSVRSTLLPPGAFDLALYSLFRFTGGIALVVLKAVGFTVLAWLLLPPRSRSAGATPLLACALLALLTLIPYASLCPAILSYFFLTLTLRLLRAQRRNRIHSENGIACCC